MSDTLDKLTDRELLELARECGANVVGTRVPVPGEEMTYAVCFLDESKLAAFAERISADQREKDAKLCESLASKCDAHQSSSTLDAALMSTTAYGLKECAAAIRSSGEQAGSTECASGADAGSAG